ncbi:MAG: hypothetical protein PVH88_16975 [Ignavibacteria bacterium]|jgi:hypothetical protein
MRSFFVIFFLLYAVILPESAKSKDEPTKAYLGLALNYIDKVSVENHSFYAEFYFDMRWRKGSRSPLNFEFYTAKDISKSFVFQWEDSLWNYYSCKIKGSFRSSMNVKTFPFDSHELRLEVSDFSLTRDSLIYVKYKDYTQFSGNYHLNGWNILGYESDTLTSDYYGSEFSALYYTINIERKIGSAIYKVFVPILIILAISLLTLFIPLNDFSTRINLGITTILGFVALHFTITSQFHELKYPTNIDVIIVAMYSLIFLSLIKIIISNRCLLYGQEEKAKKIDRLAITILPAICVVAIVLFYLILYL